MTIVGAAWASWALQHPHARQLLSALHSSQQSASWLPPAHSVILHCCVQATFLLADEDRSSGLKAIKQTLSPKPCLQATFLLADEDKSGGLNEREHFAFSHPEDSSNAALHAHLRRQDVTDRDRNHDGRWGRLESAPVGCPEHNHDMI